ncbi:MAG: ring-hydroxylating oxygenase subunit alpha [Alteromonadaceae bacterium]|uniref:aromatic ring-hydroxylating oxygenase subunit alpha n=1 Tax=Paraglaciecola chathamensis TaxID=368405 RepID=UPI000C52BEE5|nr:aromatic ring-hydroxylating dioxygenase subunit alpha [Paraglaciecola agarilytica]MBN24902.1 ring-hydroxylating oxygenase subunit alpha [Alteromonadaceae bacterium]|tara:strand:+ start:26103 stop:27362 length:1260 start_codon:yes stop_codon:yes gene_type:complete
MNNNNLASKWGELIHTDGVSGRLYNDPDIYQEELKKIWYTTWVYVGHESEVPNKNDFIMKSIGPEPVIMTRDRAGEINLLLNRCTHRGNQVCVKNKGNTKSFTCPYHSWTFATDGRLMGQAFPDGFQNADKSKLGLGRVTRVASYGGFVFGSFAETGPSLEEHLGGAKETIDRLLANSPSGEIEITAGYLQHKVAANWKLMVENETDGYHPGFVHASVFQAMDSRINELYGDKSTSLSRDYGNGHTEIDLRPEFRKRDEELSWFNTKASRLPAYVKQMQEKHGVQKAREIMIDGTPHVMIFPNLFIAEIQIFVIQPLSVNESIQHVTAVQFKGSPDINRRLRQQTMGSVGPAGFLLADDSEMYERNQLGLQVQSPEFTYNGRGDHRERLDEDGFLVGDSTDDLPSRGIWKHYRKMMEAV